MLDYISDLFISIDDKLISVFSDKYIRAVLIGVIIAHAGLILFYESRASNSLFASVASKLVLFLLWFLAVKYVPAVTTVISTALVGIPLTIVFPEILLNKLDKIQSTTNYIKKHVHPSLLNSGLNEDQINKIVFRSYVKCNCDKDKTVEFILASIPSELVVKAEKSDLEIIIEQVNAPLLEGESTSNPSNCDEQSDAVQLQP